VVVIERVILILMPGERSLNILVKVPPKLYLKPETDFGNIIDARQKHWQQSKILILLYHNKLNMTKNS